ncbi:MAG: AI-2E family transporter [Elusimicrobia bacterium]|nr:AI-2E family transporter [Elusimicrobiota bacterium]
MNMGPLHKKLAIWGGFILILYVLRDFFPLFFMTFVLSYIGLTVTRKLEPHVPWPWLAPTLFVAFLGGLLAVFGMLTVPRITHEARSFQERVAEHPSWHDFLDSKLKSSLGPRISDALAEEIGEAPPTDPEAVKSLARGLLGQITEEDRRRYLRSLAGLGKTIWRGIVYLFMSIIFSYLFLLSVPAFSAGVRALETSRLSEAYREVGPSIAQFAKLMGRAFEAQTLIAVANTAVTAVGMALLGIPNIGILSVAVFLCSFIPVAGVFISTAPICLAGLIMDGGGLRTAGGVVLMVAVVHMVEAYVLNPRIYGHHMKMNPLAVLFGLVLAEHLVGVWGLVIAVPLMTYVWKHVVLGEAANP